MRTSDDLNFKNYKVISKDILTNYKNSNIPPMNYSQISKYLKESNPLNIFEALVNLRILLSTEIKKKEPKLLFHDIESLFNILANFPEEYKYECLLCLTFIEYINFKLFKHACDYPTEGVFKIILYIFDNVKEFNLELLEANLNYVNVLLNYVDFDIRIGKNYLYSKLFNLVKMNYLTKESIIIKIIKILIKLFALIGVPDIIKNNNFELIAIINNILDKHELNQDTLVNSLKLLLKIVYEFDYLDDSSTMLVIMNKMIEINLLPKLINFLDILYIKSKKKQIYYSLRIIGCFSNIEENVFNDKLIELNILTKLKKLMHKKYPYIIRREATLIISNIAAGTDIQINKLYENNYLDILLDIILNEKDGPIKNNCLWALYNCVNLRNEEYFINLIQNGIIYIIISRLKIDIKETLELSLEALSIILKKSKKLKIQYSNIITQRIKELNILKELINLLERKITERCRSKVLYILQSYFKVDELDLIDTDYDDKE